MRTAIVDSSPLILLDHLGLARELSLFFDKVYVPRAVQREVNKKGRFRYRLKKLYETQIFVPCTVANETRIKLLLLDLGEGEAEAIVQAQEKNIIYIIADERPARQMASNMGKKPVGTLAILARLSRGGLAPELRSLVRKLERGRKFRVSEELIQQAIESASEPI